MNKKNKNKKNINWSKWQTIVQIPILIIMCWSTVETCSMRETSEDQNFKNTMPIIVFENKTVNKYLYSYPIIKNIGNGPAFNISVSEIKNRHLTLKFDSIAGISKEDEIKLTYIIDDTARVVTISNDSLKFQNFINYRGKGFKGQGNGQKLGDIIIKYEDIVGKKYSTKQNLYYDWNQDKLFTKVLEYPNPWK